jgi:hypothetical protein
MVREWIIYGFQIMQNVVKYWKIGGNAFVDHRYHPFFLKRIPNLYVYSGQERII